MGRYVRKTNPGVRDGVVQKKHRTDTSRHYKNYFQEVPVIDRLRPGRGYCHLIGKRDLVRFIGILPDWDELSKGLDAVVLAPGDEKAMGWYGDGIVAVCAWPREIAGECDVEWVQEHREILDRLGVRLEKRARGSRFVHWTQETARAFQLLHVLLHELGHHHDRMSTRSMREASRGEGYAERYAMMYSRQIWGRYLEVFGWP